MATTSHVKFSVVPPRKDVCQECAVKHDPELPHNKLSLHYQYSFYAKHGRFPTWEDAMAHCSDEMKQFWIEELTARGEGIQTP